MPTYYSDRDLVRPYRVGMSCGFCHVGPNPIRPPADAEAPRWENLSALVGAQYFWWDRVFNWMGTKNAGSIFYQALHVSRPGTLDTSLVSTDNINNPRTMNAVYQMRPRMAQAKAWGKEKLAGGALDNKQFNHYVPPDDPLAVFFAKPDTSWTPRVLKDGSDSVGALGALNRVYLNIGLFSEEWLLHFRPLLGGRPISPIPIATAQRNSAYWLATEMQSLKMARYLLAGSDPHYLKDAPGSKGYLADDAATIERGKLVFAEVCARCHSSKLPALPGGLDLENANGPNYLAAWNAYWAWTKTDAFKTAMRQRVLEPDFLDDNYLSNELRVPITLLGINACSPLGTNAIRNNIWDNFSVGVLQDAPLGRQHHDPASSVGQDDGLSAAGGRPRLHPAGVARQRLVDRAASSEQHRRAVRIQPVGRGADALLRAIDRTAALAGTPRERPAVRQREGADGRHHRSDHRRQLPRGARIATSPCRSGHWSSCRGRSFPSWAATARRCASVRFRRGCRSG